MTFAPIVLFVYNRLAHTKETVTALLKNAEAAESELFIFSDAAKSVAKATAINEVREYIRTIKGFKQVHIIEQPANLGLSASIIAGVTEIVNRYGSIIVLEDDLAVAPYFLDYMNRSLNNYATDEQIACIHGYVYPLDTVQDPLFFLKGADCWGWATWKRGWDLFERDGKKLQQQLSEKGLIAEFDFDNTYPYYQMLLDQVNGLNQSWAVRWYASCFLQNKLTLYPGVSLVFNTGLDNSGTHCVGTDDYNTEINLERIPDLKPEVVPNEKAKEAFKVFFEKTTTTPEVKISLLRRGINKLKRLIKAGS